MSKFLKKHQTILKNSNYMLQVVPHHIIILLKLIDKAWYYKHYKKFSFNLIKIKLWYGY